MPDPKAVIYHVDVYDNLVSAEGLWDKFAIDNGADELTFNKIRGRNLWGFISGDAIKHVYSQILKRVRSGKTLEFEFRCDSPHLRRFMTMVIAPAEEGVVRFETLAVRTEERLNNCCFPIPGGSEDDRLVISCSWCNKFRIGDGRWLEAENVVDILNIFDGPPYLSLSHGMCDACYQAALSKIPLR